MAYQLTILVKDANTIAKTVITDGKPQLDLNGFLESYQGALGIFKRPVVFERRNQLIKTDVEIRVLYTNDIGCRQQLHTVVAKHNAIKVIEFALDILIHQTAGVA